MLLWHGWQYQAREEAEKVLFEEETELRTIVISESSYKASRIEENEIMLHGKLYDVKSFEQTGDSVRLLVYHDRHEQELYSILGKQLKEQDSPVNTASKPFSTAVSKWMETIFLLPEYGFALNLEQTKNRNSFSWVFNAYSRFPEPPFTLRAEVLKFDQTNLICVCTVSIYRILM